jgi:hypothetical protein
MKAADAYLGPAVLVKKLQAVDMLLGSVPVILVYSTFQAGDMLPDPVLVILL